MGMSIEEAEALEILKDIRLNVNYLQNRESRTGMACKLAINTMRKYQKIKNIICKWEDGLYDDEGLCDIEVLEMISDEVNGDGNDSI